MDYDIHTVVDFTVEETAPVMRSVWTLVYHEEWATPVSYTHLDVYKRQAIRRC